MLAANIFNGMQRRMEQEHPDWFKDEEDSEPSEMDPQSEAERWVEPQSEIGFTPAQIKATLQTINGRIGWIWWFALGALAVSLFNH